MTKRIGRSLFCAALAAALLTALLISVALFSTYEKQSLQEIRNEADLLSYALSRVEDETAYFDSFHSENRITLIAPDGQVLYDSAAQAREMENHAERPEIADALEKGWGESRRHSSTLSEETLYYAVSTRAGNVLRISVTRSTALGVFLRLLLPLLAAILALTAVFCLLVARAVSQRILEPINRLNLEEPLENDAYDELAPLLRRLDHQKKEIASAMRRMENKQSQLEAITGNMREGLMMLGREGDILSINESAAQIFAVEEKSRLGQDVLSVSRNLTLKNAVEKAQNGESSDAIWENGGKYFRIFANPVWLHEQVIGEVLLLQDVTQQYHAEISRKEFTANVSHELKTPLTAISGYAEIIRDGVARPEDVPAFAQRIHKETARLITLLGDIFELARLDEGKGLGEKEEVNLLLAAGDAISRQEGAAEKKGIDILLEGEPLCVSGYRLLLGEMIYNLVDNAVKYTPNGGNVRVSVEKRGAKICLSVADNGIGIAPEHQIRIFERFYRVDKSRSKATGGTGLGLAIVKHGALLHGAEIELESQEGKGTTVTVAF